MGPATKNETRVPHGPASVPGLPEVVVSLQPFTWLSYQLESGGVFSWSPAGSYWTAHVFF